jgi:UDP-2,4-diacetamido-2,4,6-trideoxy-beta-L-altropyranose hydrolase
MRRATADDCRLYFEWASDPVVRAASFTPDAIEWDGHVAWFEARLQSIDSVLYVVSNDASQPIGQVRFDAGPDGDLEIGVSLAAAFRGQGRGREVIDRACRTILEQRPGARLVAHVKPDNRASLMAFEAAGFERRGTVQIKGCDAIRLERRPA